MHWLPLGMALLLALAIIAVGAQYILAPRAATLMFGLPLPENGNNILWWLRLKGVRDIVSGLVVISMVVWGTSELVGVVLLAETFVPIGDMFMVLSAKGSTSKALGMHGVTAVVMVVTAIFLIR